jgi:hypothetical protein
MKRKNSLSCSSTLSKKWVERGERRCAAGVANACRVHYGGEYNWLMSILNHHMGSIRLL